MLIGAAATVALAGGVLSVVVALAAGHKPPVLGIGSTPARGAPAKRGGTSRVSAAAAALTQFKVCIYPAIACTSASAAYMKTKPSRIITSADGSGYVKDLRWTGWGTTTAQGAGILEVDNCSPSCAAGAYTGYPATVMLSGLTPYGNGEQAYARMVVSAPSAPNSPETFKTGLVP